METAHLCNLQIEIYISSGYCISVMGIERGLQTNNGKVLIA